MVLRLHGARAHAACVCVRSAGGMAGAAGAVDVDELELLAVDTVFVFKVPPRTSAVGYKCVSRAGWSRRGTVGTACVWCVHGRAADWGEQAWAGRLSVVSRGADTAIKLIGRDGARARVCPRAGVCVCVGGSLAVVDGLRPPRERERHEPTACVRAVAAGRLFAMCVVTPNGPPTVEKGAMLGCCACSSLLQRPHALSLSLSSLLPQCLTARATSFCESRTEKVRSRLRL
jgi:hypothetical protein